MDLIANDSEKFNSLKESIRKNIGFDSRNYTDNFLKRRIEVRLRYLSIKSYEEYSRLLAKDPEECKKLEKELTIHTTNFFRDSSLYFYFMKEIIPYLVKIKKESSQKFIKIWSAGSSTGEEAYSIAVCFLEVLGSDLSGYKVKIQGTDYDKNTVERARNPCYDEVQFREMPVNLRDKYFDKKETDIGSSYVPKHFVTALVDFQHGDILLPSKPVGMDIIFCRNTVIYFDIPTKSKLYEDIYKALPSKGLFIMGKTEMLMGASRELFKIYNQNERVYLKE